MPPPPKTQSNSQDVKTNGIKISEMVFREEVIQGSGQDLVKWTNNFVSTTWLYVGVRGANTFKLRVPPKGEWRRVRLFKYQAKKGNGEQVRHTRVFFGGSLTW